jgi:probable HAF family extracellular repeat protein
LKPKIPNCLNLVIGTMLLVHPHLFGEHVTAINFPIVAPNCLPFPGVNFATSLPAISSDGRIVGTYQDCSLGLDFPFPIHAFLLSDGGEFTVFQVPQSLAPFAGVRETVPAGINAQGDIVGTFNLSFGRYSVGSRGFLLRNGEFSVILPPGATGSFSSAGGINDQGDVVGTFADAQGGHMFLLHEGIYTTIDVPGFTGLVPQGINSRGDIVGYSSNAGGSPHGFVLRDGNFRVIDVGASTSLVAINNEGVILGQFTDVPPGGPVSHNFWASLPDDPNGELQIFPFDIPGGPNGLAFGMNSDTLVGTFFLGEQGFFRQYGFRLTD